MTAADYYADSYGHFGIHEEMIKDDVRTKTYMHSILRNRHLFEGKVVLDVGCGTGILSLFAAKAGARKVIGVDMSAIAEHAKEIVRANGFSDVVTIVRGKIEEVELPEGIDKVDIIISEWMGYFLLYESMLDSVLYARDKWLAPGGMLFPDQATISLAAAEDAEYRAEKIEWWDDVYGFDMSCIGRVALSEPLVDCVEASQLLSKDTPLVTLDLLTMTKEDAAFSAPFSLAIERDDFVHALVGSFDVVFRAAHAPLTLRTGPKTRPTHWKQTVFYLERPLVAHKGDLLKGTLACAPNAKNPRDLDVTITYTLHRKGAAGETKQIVQEYKMR